ncbi:NUDIX domain-containing protein [Nonomuraea sp. NPDC000554]|uniref:NUDIX domain-containing protein n=1 Tax=Nonomuraea sp. NPDC000554 TaxID=3154259 RepID=UPI003331CBB2
MSSPTPRPTARVILATPDDRILLFRFSPPDPWPQTPAWHLPGGAVQPGESLAEAAAREAREETGHAVTTADLGDAVAVNEGEWSIEGHRYYTVHTYFFARVPSPSLDISAMEPEESDSWLGYWWWSVAELMATTERVFPPGLATVLPGVLSGARPGAPVRLAWTHVQP